MADILRNPWVSSYISPKGPSGGACPLLGTSTVDGEDLAPPKFSLDPNNHSILEDPKLCKISSMHCRNLPKIQS